MITEVMIDSLVSTLQKRRTLTVQVVEVWKTSDRVDACKAPIRAEQRLPGRAPYCLRRTSEGIKDTPSRARLERNIEEGEGHLHNANGEDTVVGLEEAVENKESGTIML